MKEFGITSRGGVSDLSQKKHSAKRALLYILTPVICALLCLGTVFSFFNINNKVYAATSVKASAAYLDLDGSGNILNAFEGAQKEKLYLGSYNGSPLNWLVLKKNDTVFGSGNNLLLFAEDVIGKETWNDYGNSVANAENGAMYVYYGTSKMRARLNGGYYIDQQANLNSAYSAQISDAESYKTKLFKDLNPEVLMTSNDIITHGVVNTNNATVPSYLTKDNGSNYFTNRYDPSVLAAQPVNTKTGVSDGNNNFSMTLSNASGMTETTKGDKMFLLSYDDLNNAEYGFVNAGNKVYALVANPGCGPNYVSQGYTYGYPSWYENQDYVNLQINGFNAKSNASYRIRNPLRNLAGVNNNAVSMLVQHESDGSVKSIIQQDCATNPYGVRPAFVLDTSKIAYATATNVTGSFQSLSAMPAQLDYKMFVKTQKYDDASSRAKGNVFEKNGTLHITYNNPTGLNSGNLLVLLSNKSATDGSVAYQAVIAVNSAATETNTAATSIPLPSGISLSDYNVSMLYVSDNGGNNSESVYCYYPTDSGIEAPKDISGLTYAPDTNRWINNLGNSKPDWCNLDIYNNSVYVSDISVEYFDNLGNAATNVTTADIINAGKYKVTMTLADGLKWSDGDATGTRQFTITIGKTDPTVTAVLGTTGSRYLTQGLPLKEDKTTADIINNASGGTDGSFTWFANQELSTSKTKYKWLFTPTDTNNYNNLEKEIDVIFIEDTITGVKAELAKGSENTPLYTSYSLDRLKGAPWNLTVSLTYESGQETATSDYELKVIADGSTQDNFHAGTNTVRVRSNGYNATVTVEVIEAEIHSIDTVDFNQNGKKIYYNTDLNELKDLFEVEACWNYNTSKVVKLTSDDFSLKGTLNVGTGTSELYIVYKKGGADVEYPVPKGALNKLEVSALSYDISVSFTGNLNPVYDGTNKVLTLSGALPDGVNATVTYKKDGVEAEPIDAGVYTVTATFTGDYDHYEKISDITETLTIKQAKVTGITFASATKPEITGKTYTSEDFKAVGVPEWVTVEYLYDGAQFTGASAAGSYVITARFTHSNANYEQISDMQATLTISDKPPVEGADDIFVQPKVSATYTGSPIDYTAKNVPAGVNVTYEILKDGKPFSGTEITAAGEYTVTVKFETGADKAPISDKVSVITVAKADVKMPGVKFNNVTVVVDGEAHTITITGTLPTVPSVSVSYEVTGESGLSFIEIGTYEFVAKFTHDDTDNYNAIPDMTATLKIVGATVTGITASVSDEAHLTAKNTLDDLKPFISVNIKLTGNNTTEATEFDLTCATLREGGLFDVGAQTVTVKYTDEGGAEYTATVRITVAKAKVELPVYLNTLSYTGKALSLTAADFRGFDASIMSLVESKLPGEIKNAGVYKAVFAITDAARYEWDKPSAKSVRFYGKAAASDGAPDPVLAANEVAVELRVAKAVISATKEEGELPVFASDSYTGSWANAVNLKYYSDRNCINEVAADELEAEKQYFVKVGLLDEANFELGDGLSDFAITPFPYTAPAQALSTGEQILAFIKENWLWIVLAVAVLILLILIIALVKHSSRKRREREEERMIRLMQQHSASPYIPMSQIPQADGAAMNGSSLPPELLMLLSGMNAKIEMLQNNAAAMALPSASQQPASASTSPELLAMLNGLNAKIDKLQSDVAANELASARDALAQARDERLRGEIKTAAKAGQGNISSEAISEMVNESVKNAMASNAANESAGRPAPRGLGSRPLVEPAPRVIIQQPVDDGRIYDVGGFYDLVDDEDMASISNVNKKNK